MTTDHPLGFDDLAQRLTHRLRGDGELRMEVAHELRTHLEDAAADYRAGGMSQDEAHAAAIKAMGNEQELADQLYAANRRRMRLRAVAWWTARATLLPAAAVAVLVALGLAPQIIAQLGTVSGSRQGGDESMLLTHVPAAKSLSPDQRLILLGDPNKAAPSQRAKAIVDRWPDNRVYHAHYAAMLTLDINSFLSQSPPPVSPAAPRWRPPSQPSSTPAAGATPSVPRIFPPLVRRDGVAPADVVQTKYVITNQKRFNEFMAAMDRGEQLDPDNGLYNLYRGAVLILLSSRASDDPKLEYKGISHRPGGCSSRPHLLRVEVTDEAQFGRGLEQFRLAASKPRIDTYMIEILEIRMKLLGQATSWAEMVAHMQLEAGTLMTSWSQVRDAAKRVDGYAVGLAQKGQGKEAVELTGSTERVATRMGSDGVLIDMLVALAMRGNSLAAQEQVHRALDQQGQAKMAAQRLEQEREFWRWMHNQPTLHGSDLDRAGMLDRILVPSLPGYQADFAPMRNAERVLWQRLVLADLLLLSLVAAVMMAVKSGLSYLVQRGKDCQPRLLWIGWKRFVFVLLAFAGPLSLYYVYQNYMPFSGRDFGVGYKQMMLRVGVELAALTALVLVLTGLLAARFIRRRAVEVGLAVPQGLTKPAKVLLVIGSVLAAGVVAYMASWEHGVGRYSEGEVAAVALIVAGIVYLLIWGVRSLARQLGNRQFAIYNRTLLRSLVPMVLAAVVVTGLLGGLVLNHREKATMAQVQSSRSWGLHNEVKNSAFRHLHDRFRQQAAELQTAKTGDDPRK